MAGGDKNHFLIFFFLLRYMSRNKSNRNEKFILFFLIIFTASKLFYQIIFFHQADIHKELMNCQNTDFFSKESIKLCNSIVNAHNQVNLSLLAISKMKFNHYSLFLIFVLLLSGDIMYQPRPRTKSKH